MMCHKEMGKNKEISKERNKVNFIPPKYIIKEIAKAIEEKALLFLLIKVPLM